MIINYESSFYVSDSDIDRMYDLCKEKAYTPKKAIDEISNEWADCEKEQLNDTIIESISKEITERLKANHVMNVMDMNIYEFLKAKGFTQDCGAYTNLENEQGQDFGDVLEEYGNLHELIFNITRDCIFHSPGCNIYVYAFATYAWQEVDVELFQIELQ
jgi:hypothetical protein